MDLLDYCFQISPVKTKSSEIIFGDIVDYSMGS